MSDPTPDTRDVDIMLARAANITERTLDRFARDNWSYIETDYARKLIAGLADEVVSLRARLAATEVQRDTAWREADALRADLATVVTGTREEPE